MERSKLIKITKWHFILLIFILSNFTLNKIIGFGFNTYIITACKIALYLSGIFLFFVSLKPFKAIAIYFSFYVMTPTVVALLYFVHGIFLGILASIFLAPVFPLEPDYSSGDLRVYERFNGFLGRCCDYYVSENWFYVFEDYIGDVQSDGPVNLEKAKFSLEGDSIRIEVDSVYRLKVE